MMNMLKLQLNDLSFNDRHCAVVFDEMARDASNLMISIGMEADVLYTVRQQWGKFWSAATTNDTRYKILFLHFA